MEKMENDRDVHVDGASVDWYPFLKINAKNNRKEQTYAEEIIWQHIRGRQLGYKFRRQHPLLDYIVDFYCSERKLVIEVDGEYHNEEEQVRLDNYRTERLTNIGYKVIRFTNEEVVAGTEKVIEKIKDILDE